MNNTLDYYNDFCEWMFDMGDEDITYEKAAAYMAQFRLTLPQNEYDLWVEIWNEI